MEMTIVNVAVSGTAAINKALVVFVRHVHHNYANYVSLQTL
jgi:hypothetical protein